MNVNNLLKNLSIAYWLDVHYGLKIWNVNDNFFNNGAVARIVTELGSKA